MNGTYSKEEILGWLESKIAIEEVEKTGANDDLSIMKAIRFVLKWRTEENWGPKELTMADAMRLP